MKSLLTYNTNRWAKRNRALRTAVDYNHSQKIGLIFTIDDREKHDIIKNFIKLLEQDRKKVQVLAFLPEKQENHEFLFDYFTKKDVSFWGKYTSELIDRFTVNEFDYLFHIDFESSNFINGILALTKAKCRIGGVHSDDHNLYEMIVKTPKNDFQKLVNEMYNYTSILN